MFLLLSSINITLAQVTAQKDTVNTNEDQPTNIDVSANDSGNYGIPILVSNAKHGLATVNGNGTIDYISNQNYFGKDTFEYKICDNTQGALCDSAVVIINVITINDAPIANRDDINADEDRATQFDVSTNDDITDGPSKNYFTNANTKHGTIISNVNGIFSYIADQNYNGNDTFIYQLCDNALPNLCDTAVVIITVSPINDAPTAIGETVNVRTNNTINKNVSGNDYDVDGPQKIYQIFGGVNTPNGVVQITSNGIVTYTPNANFIGLDSVIYQLCDASTVSPTNICDTALLIFNVSPFSNIQSSEIVEKNRYVNLEYFLNSDTVIVLSNPKHGAIADYKLGMVKYTPTIDYTGNDSFLAEVKYETNLDTVLFYLTVVNSAFKRAPRANTDYIYQTSDIETFVIDVLANDYDLDDSLKNASIFNEPKFGTAVINADGTISYTRNNTFAITDTFKYQVCDLGSPNICGIGSVILFFDAYKINVVIFEDFNANGVKEASEKSLYRRNIEATNIKNASEKLNYTSGANGNILAYLRNKNAYNIKAITPSNSIATTKDTITVNENMADTTIYFGQRLNPTYIDLECKLFQTTASRPGFMAGYALHISNNSGVKVNNSQVVFEYPEHTTFVSATVMPDVHNSAERKLYYTIFELQSEEVKNINITIQIAQPPTVNNGDLLCANLEIKNNLIVENDYTNNTSEVCVITTGSYDPNEKQVLPKGESSNGNILKNTDLTYTIFFQNKGTDTAFNIRVADTLSSFLDANTIEVLATSHPMALVQNDGILSFNFNNILLPDDKTNEPGSHGYVIYKISPKLDLPIGVKIENTAHIYFDFNTAIVTNTTKNTIVNKLLSVRNQKIALKSIAVPNPFTDVTNIYFENAEQKPTEIKVYNALGEKIITQKTNVNYFTITMESMPSGLYYYQIANKNALSNGKILKQ